MHPSAAELLLENASWLRTTLGQTDLCDQRRTKRLLKVATTLAAHPTASLPDACGAWSATKAAYRFFDLATHAVPDAPARIGAAHAAATKARLQGVAVVLAVQDTTVLDFRGHPATTGLGPTGPKGGHGLWVHSTLAVSTEGVPLGLLGQAVWARDPEQTGLCEHRRERAFVDKESHRWVAALEESTHGLPLGVCLVQVGDREADIYDLFVAAARQPCAALLIRAAWDRRVQGPEGRLQAAVAALPVASRRQLAVPRAEDRPARTATVDLRFGRMTLRPPQHRQQEGLPPVALDAILVNEVGAPAGVPPLRWLLLSSLPCAGVAAAWERVTWYTYRWRIERYHLVLKSGCRIEARQLATAARLTCCLAVSAVVAVRLLQLLYLARETPAAPAAPWVSPVEWSLLWAARHPATAPPEASLRTVVREIAMLGGFLGRRSDGEPGVITLWRGLQHLDDLLRGYHLAQATARDARDVGKA